MIFKRPPSASSSTAGMPPLPAHWRSLARAFIHEARARWPEPAVADSSGLNLTYGRLFVQALALARVLGRRLGSATYVGLLIPPSVAGALVNLAVALLGKVPVNLNYTTDKAQVDSAIRQCKIRLVITSRRAIDRLKIEPEADLAYLEDLCLEVAKWDKAWAAFVARAIPVPLLGMFVPGLRDDCLESLSAVLFTSGTTGEPKGVILSQGNLLSNIRQIEVQFEPLPDEVVLGILPFFHAMGLTVTLWAVLCLGRRAVYHANPLDARTVGLLCREHGITLIFATPTFMRLYLRKCRREEFATVRRVALGSEKLTPQLADDLHRNLGIVPLEGYGATETSPVISFNVDHPVAAGDGKSVPGNRLGTVGRPLPGTLIATIDPDSGTALPKGAEGIICVKGPQVMTGYLDRPKLTAVVLREGWFISGDIGHLDDDGFLSISGRVSRFSKVGGELVSHERVEAMIRDATGAGEQAVAIVGLPDPRKGERLVVLYSDLGGKSPEELSRLLCRGELPKLWVPAPWDYIRIEAIPILSNGKVDFCGLRRIALGHSPACGSDGSPKPELTREAESECIEAERERRNIDGNREIDL